LLKVFRADSPGAAEPFVVKRELKVASHNGRRALGQWKTVRLEPSPEDAQILEVRVCVYFNAIMTGLCTHFTAIIMLISFFVSSGRTDGRRWVFRSIRQWTDSP